MSGIRDGWAGVRRVIPNRGARLDVIAVALLTVAICAGMAGCGSGSGVTPGPTPTPTPPSVSSISPNAAPAGAPAFTLTVNGSNFVSGAQVEWNGSNRTTTLVSNSQLQAHILAADLATPGKVTVTVVNPAPGGGSSNAVTFTIPADKITFESNRALDGTDAANTNSTTNIWVMNPDGSSATPLTKLTANQAFSFAPAAWSPDGSKIVYSSARALDGSNAANTNSVLNIWVMNPDGSGATPFTKLTALGPFGNLSTGSPVWSPDGSKIAFQSGRALDGSDADNTNHVSNIWVMNSDGSGATPVTKLTAGTADSFRPSWSPDGSKIAFESSRALDGSNAANTNSTSNIWVINPDGSGATALTKLTALGAGGSLVAPAPAWSPDGSKIAFQSAAALDGSNAANTNGTSNIWVINPDGSGATALTKLTANAAGSITPAVWSPDGSKIAFASRRALDGSDAADTNHIFNIWVMNSDGSGATPLTKLTNGVASCFDPSWSPDGSKIDFDSARALDGSDAASTNHIANIWVMNSDGSGATPLTKVTAAGAGSDSPVQP